MKPTTFTDEQYAAIAWADPSEFIVALSQRLGLNIEAVGENRRRIARAGGWWCELEVLCCPECGKPLLSGASQRGILRRRRHPDCQRSHLSRQQRDDERRRTMERRQQRTLAAMRQRYQSDFAPTGPYTFRDHVPWT